MAKDLLDDADTDALLQLGTAKECLRWWMRGRQDDDRGCSPAWRASCWNVECTLQYISRVPAGVMNSAAVLG
jgi:hypothetical protein